MTVDEALAKARRKYPELRLGQLVYNAVVLSHPEVRPKRITKEEQIRDNKARTVDILYSLTDEQMEKALDRMERLGRTTQNETVGKNLSRTKVLSRGSSVTPSGPNS